MSRWFLLVSALGAGLLGALMSCKRESPSPSPAAATSASRDSVSADSARQLASPPSSAASASPTPSAVTAAKARPQDVAQRLLMDWNAALDHHSVDALAPLYAPKVDFYGQHRTAEQVLVAKRQAFEKQPDFKQRVSGASFRKDGDGFRVSFKKVSGAQLKNETVGVLVVKPLGGKWQITEESDDATDARFKPKAGTCPEAAQGILSSEPAVLADMARVAREYPNVNAGGLQYDLEEHSDRYSGSQGYFHEDHYEPRWWVDAGNGEITVRDAYTGELLPVTPAQRALVRKLCTGKLPNEDDAPAP